MKQAGRIISLLTTVTLMGALLLACGSNAEQPSAEQVSTSPTTEVSSSPAAESPAASAEAETGTRIFKDWTGHDVEVPVTPQRVIYHGETTGDLLALGVTPIGVMKNTEGSVYEEQVKDAEDVGFPISVEKSLSLSPDLIIFGNSDDAQYDALAKVAPTVTFDTFAPLEDRMRILGDLLNKKQEAEDWIAQYTAKTKEMWAMLHENGLKEGETASIFTMYPGNRLFIMANAGLPQAVYNEDGFKPTPLIQEIIEASEGFREISAEILPEAAGDRIFILDPVPDDAKKDTEELLKSTIWKNLPAVKAGKVYYFDIQKASSDATSRDWLIDALPAEILKK